MNLLIPVLAAVLLLSSCGGTAGREVPPYPDTGLPIVELRMKDSGGVQSSFEPASVRILLSGGGQMQDSLGCSVKLRGHSTRAWPKKPYNIKLDAARPLLGMNPSRRWALLANFCDRTLMRNMVAMRVASLTSLEWTPAFVPVELVLDGRHMGSYLLIEQVRVEPGRIALQDGGVLMELDFHDVGEEGWIDPHGACDKVRGGIPFCLKYPEDSPEAEREARDYVSEVAGVLYSDGFADPVSGYAAYLDVDSFVDYWIVFELMINHELGNPGSVYMHRDAGGKLVAGPCWDFDWGTLSYHFTPAAREELINLDAIWYARLFEDPSFAAKVRARFAELLPELRTIPSYIDDCERLLKESARINFEMWDPSGDRTQNAGRLVNGDENLPFEEAVSRLRAIYLERLALMEREL